jgi:hypothetical protein
MVFGLVPDALDLMKSSRVCFVNLCELCEHFVARVLESLEGFEPSTRCLEGSRSVQLSYRDVRPKYNMVGKQSS